MGTNSWLLFDLMIMFRKIRNGNGLIGLHGQYLLENPAIIETIVDKTDIKNKDIVLEIGSGTGSLTIELLKKAKRVVSIELDYKMVIELKKRFPSTTYEFNFTLIHGDVLKVSIIYHCKKFNSMALCV